MLIGEWKSRAFIVIIARGEDIPVIVTFEYMDSLNCINTIKITTKWSIEITTTHETLLTTSETPSTILIILHPLTAPKKVSNGMNIDLYISI